VKDANYVSTDNTRYQWMSRQCAQLLGRFAGNSKSLIAGEFNAAVRVLPGTIFSSLLLSINLRGFIFGSEGPDVSIRPIEDLCEVYVSHCAAS
jgi:hypothetical protein